MIIMIVLYCKIIKKKNLKEKSERTIWKFYTERKIRKKQSERTNLKENIWKCYTERKLWKKKSESFILKEKSEINSQRKSERKNWKKEQHATYDR